jgi:methionyl-tRNA formyltransferase
MKKILFCAYREWAIESCNSIIQNLDKEWSSFTVKTQEELLEVTASDPNWNVIILIGWSWKIPKKIIDSFLVVGMHPSDLPKYSGGSPIQNQIIDGLNSSKATLFKLNEEFDKGEIIDKEQYSLEGHLKDVLLEISNATKTLVLRFIKKYPNNQYIEQHVVENNYKRLKPEQSKISLPTKIESIENAVDKKHFTCLELWNHIRCREDPYPNAYFEDETGKLLIRSVEFIPRKS